MEREEIEHVVKLAQKAHEATQKAKESYGEYVLAASELYKKKAAETAKKLYESCMHSANFEQSFKQGINHDFNIDISEYSGHSFAQASAAPVAQKLEPEIAHREEKPVKDLFTVEFDEEEGDKTARNSDTGWQARDDDR